MAANGQNAWTIMLYLSGDNNLSPEMVRAITEIESSGVPNGFTITIQYDALSPCVPTCRFVLSQTEVLPKEQAPPGIPFQYGFVETAKDEKGRPVEDAGDPETLSDFVKWSTQNFPSACRMLILSGHGSGAVGDFLTDDNGKRKARQPGSLTIKGLAKALREAVSPNSDPAVHVLGMDSCLMSTLEVAYQLRRIVPYLVASEGFVPNAGWPYAHLLKRLRQHVDLSLASLVSENAPKAISEFIVEDCSEYYEQYLAAGVSFDIAACDVAKTTELVDAVTALANAFEYANIATLAQELNLTHEVLERRLYNNVILAHWRAQSYKFEQYTDVWDFASELQKEESLLDEECQRIMNAVTPGAIFRQSSVGVDFQHSHGLSIYFPWSTPAYYDDDYLELYRKLDFPEQSKWFAFLKQYLEKTRREVREKDGANVQDFPKPPEDETQKETFRSRQPLVTARNKYVAEYSKYVAEYSKYLLERLGGRNPWSMKNPPQQVKVLAREKRKPNPEPSLTN